MIIITLSYFNHFTIISQSFHNQFIPIHTNSYQHILALSLFSDGWSVLPCLSLPFLTKLISNTKKDSFLTWIALTELTRRLARSLTCTMEELPVSDQNITAVMHYQQEEEQNVRVFFYGTDSLWIYF